jgi:hypothetical protein
MMFGVWHSLVVYFVPMYTLATPPANGLAPDLAGVGSAIFIACCLVVSLKLSMRTHCWTWIHVLVYGLSVALLFPFTYLLGIAWTSWGISAVADMAGVGTDLFLRPVYWLAAVVLVAPMSLLPDFVWTHYKRKIRPNCVVELQVRGSGVALWRVCGEGVWGGGRGTQGPPATPVLTPVGACVHQPCWGCAGGSA